MSKTAKFSLILYLLALTAFENTHRGKNMKFKIDHDYHIHSLLSTCSRDEKQTTERILAHAKEHGLDKICITDHYWDKEVDGASDWYLPQDFAHISRSLPLPCADGVKFFFGCETDMDKFKTIGIPASRFKDFDFIIVPTTHLHNGGFAIDSEDVGVAERLAKIWVDRLSAVLNSDLPFEKVGIAHLACALINRKSRTEYLRTLSLIDEGAMRSLFAKAAKLGCGIELNMSDMSFSGEEADTVLRPFRIAKEMGCKFYLGSDAHHPKDFGRFVSVFERAVDLLDLTEDDKFHINCKNKLQ